MPRRGAMAGHPFIVGNRRTAILVGITFLELNGYRFVARERDLEDFAVHVAVEHSDMPTIAEWLRAHLETRAIRGN